MHERRASRLPLSACALALFATAALLPAAHASQPAPGPGGFTLEQVLGAPFPSGLVAAPSGGKLAWISTARGVRSVWVAEPPDYKGRPLTVATEDDGEEITDLRERAVWAISTEGGPARRLAEGHSPAVQPKSVRVAFIRKSEVHSVDPTGGEPERLFQARGELARCASRPTASASPS